MMNYGKVLLKLLQEESNKFLYKDAQQKSMHLTHEIGEFQFEVRFSEIEKLGLVIENFTVDHTGVAAEKKPVSELLEEQADLLQKSITFLLEDLKLIEMDNKNHKAQLRSYPPYSEDGSKYYYQITLDQGRRIHFQRYEYSRTDKQYKKIPSQLTRETFERLVNALVAVF